jgi:DNA polymerase-4
MAQGIDGSRIEERGGDRRITGQADFEEDVIDDTAIRGAIEALAEHGGLQMRNEKLGMKNVRLAVMYSDGVEVQGFEKTKRPLVTDNEIMATAYRVYQKTIQRRIRIRSIGLALEDLVPLGYQPDLFEPETEAANRKLQEAVDKIQNRYGEGKITRGLCLKSASRVCRKSLRGKEFVVQLETVVGENGKVQTHRRRRRAGNVSIGKSERTIAARFF